MSQIMHGAISGKRNCSITRGTGKRSWNEAVAGALLILCTATPTTDAAAEFLQNRSDCGAGFEKQHGFCKPCPKGYYKDASMTGQLCRECSRVETTNQIMLCDCTSLRNSGIACKKDSFTSQGIACSPKSHIERFCSDSSFNSTSSHLVVTTMAESPATPVPATSVAKPTPELSSVSMPRTSDTVVLVDPGRNPVATEAAVPREVLFAAVGCTLVVVLTVFVFMTRRLLWSSRGPTALVVNHRRNHDKEKHADASERRSMVDREHDNNNGPCSLAEHLQMNQIELIREESETATAMGSETGADHEDSFTATRQEDAVVCQRDSNEAGETGISSGYSRLQHESNRNVPHPLVGCGSSLPDQYENSYPSSHRSSVAVIYGISSVLPNNP